MNQKTETKKLNKTNRLFMLSCCLCCGSKDNLTLDHIYPKALGGISDFFNYTTLCKTCNSLDKKNQKPKEWLAELYKTGYTNRELEEVVLFAEDLFHGVITNDSLKLLKCGGCNPMFKVFPFEDSHRLLPEAMQKILKQPEVQEVFHHEDCETAQYRPKERILVADGTIGSIVVYNGNLCSREDVINSRVADRAKCRLPVGTKVLKRDKFPVRSEQSCYCEVFDMTNPNQRWFVHERLVEYLPEEA